MSVVIPEWTPPWPASSPPGFVRVSSTHLRPSGCAEQVARKARPDVWPDARPPWEPRTSGSFPLGLVRDAVLTLLSESAPADADPAGRIAAAIDAAERDSWDEWAAESRPPVERGVVGYLEVLESLRAEGDLPESRVFADLVATQGSDDDRVEFWAWAVHHVSIDGSVREAHLLRWRDASAVPLTESEVALIAHVTASGTVVGHDKWWHPFQPLGNLVQPPLPTTARVRVIGVLDGTSDVRFEGTPGDADARFAAAVPASLTLLAGGSTSPSGACADCSVRHVCTGIEWMPACSE